jgi:hypothetical protein
MLEMEDDRARDARERSRTLEMLEMEDDRAGEARERSRTLKMLELETLENGRERSRCWRWKVMELEMLENAQDAGDGRWLKTPEYGTKYQINYALPLLQLLKVRYSSNGQRGLGME